MKYKGQMKLDESGYQIMCYGQGTVWYGDYSYSGTFRDNGNIDNCLVRNKNNIVFYGAIRDGYLFAVYLICRKGIYDEGMIQYDNERKPIVSAEYHYEGDRCRKIGDCDELYEKWYSESKSTYREEINKIPELMEIISSSQSRFISNPLKVGMNQSVSKSNYKSNLKPTTTSENQSNPQKSFGEESNKRTSSSNRGTFLYY